MAVGGWRLVLTRADMAPDALKYKASQRTSHQDLCDLLDSEIDSHLPRAERRIWQAHPVWFLDGNPIFGYSHQKPGIRLTCWSGASFDEPGLNTLGVKFKDASIFLNDATDVNQTDLQRWLTKAEEIQWHYQNLVKRKGRLERLK